MKNLEPELRVKLREEIIDEIQDYLCEWGTFRKLEDGTYLSDFMNRISKGLIDQIDRNVWYTDYDL